MMPLRLSQLPPDAPAIPYRVWLMRQIERMARGEAAIGTDELTKEAPNTNKKLRLIFGSKPNKKSS